MRWREIVESMGATTAGSVAVVAQPMGMISRNGGNLMAGKYTTDPTPNTPKEFKRYKKSLGNKSRFQNEL